MVLTQILVRTLVGKILILRIEGTQTMRALRAAIAKRTGIPENLFGLLVDENNFRLKSDSF